MILVSLKKFKKRSPEELKPRSKDARRTSGNTTRNDPFPPFFILEAQTQVARVEAVTIISYTLAINFPITVQIVEVYSFLHEVRVECLDRISNDSSRSIRYQLLTLEEMHHSTTKLSVPSGNAKIGVSQRAPQGDVLGRMKPRSVCSGGLVQFGILLGEWEGLPDLRIILVWKKAFYSGPGDLIGLLYSLGLAYAFNQYKGIELSRTVFPLGFLSTWNIVAAWSFRAEVTLSAITLKMASESYLCASLLMLFLEAFIQQR
ncbi:hypothetical protein Tco_0257682 [Tanacetum coccineum]